MADLAGDNSARVMTPRSGSAADGTHDTKEESAHLPAQPRASVESAATESSSTCSSDPSRLFIVCGRGRKAEELRHLFSECGAIKHLHFALDRSNKSRGFAFLQYEDPTCAASAIARFHERKLDDGHVLKVTIAREKPVVATGKLKRNQQSSQEQRSDSESNSEESHFPGKRQRSSPPVSAGSMPASSRRKTRTDSIETNELQATQTEEETPSVSDDNAVPHASSTPETQVGNVLEDIVSAIEKVGGVLSQESLHTGYLWVVKQRELAAAHCSRLHSQRCGDSAAEDAKRHDAEETSTEQLTSSISSFTLDATRSTAVSGPLATSISAVGLPQRVGKASLLRRRRQSMDDSDSSLEDGSDASMSRRKRSNTSHRESPKLSTTPRQPDQRDIDVSLSSLFSPSMSKKQCKRQSSDQSADVSSRSSKQRVTNSRQGRTTDVNSILMASPRDSAGAPLSVTRCKLFFISTHKFTLQELEAMFAVYGDFECVEVVKSFGRIKTMAYIKYSNPSTASSVIESFHEDISRDEEQVHGEFMKLSLADESKSVPSHPRLLQHGTFSPVTRPSGAVLLEDQTQEKQWLLILYDRSLPSQIISSRASTCAGMEFVDIKVFRSTGESQGVAFVKFEKEIQAAEAALELHQSELPAGSGKFLQAIVILDPSLFSTMHGGSQGQGTRSGEHGDGSGAESGLPGDDVDLSVVEARFAHLMRSNDQYSSYPAVRAPMLAEEAVYQYPAAPHFTSFAPPVNGPQFPGIPIQQHSTLPYGFYPQQQHFPYPSQQAQPFAYVPASWVESPPYYHPAHAMNAPPYTNVHAAYPASEYYPALYPAQVAYPVTSAETESAAQSESVVADPAPSNSASSSDSSEGANASPSIYISSGRPLELTGVVKVLDDCQGVVGITKDGEESDGVFVVEFADALQAVAAAKKLDGKMCHGKKLRVGTVQASGKARAAPSRRKRQRVDQRHRK